MMAAERLKRVVAPSLSLAVEHTPMELALLRYLALPVGRRRALERAIAADWLTQEEIAVEFSVGRDTVRAAILLVRAVTDRGLKR